MALLAEASCARAQNLDMGGAFVHRYVAGCLGVGDDAFAVVRMPGGLPSSRWRMAGVSGTKDWIPGSGGLFSFAAVRPRRSDAFGITMDHHRVGSFRQSRTSFAYGLRLSEELQAGVRIGLTHTRIDGYGSDLSLPFNLGAVYHMGRGLRFALHVDHAGRPLRRAGSAVGLPLSVHFGVGQRLSEQAGIAMHLFKQEGRPLSCIPLLQYRPADVLDVRLGLSTQTSGMYLCLGLLQKGWRLDVSLSRNGALGWASGLALQWTDTEEGAR